MDSLGPSIDVAHTKSTSPYVGRASNFNQSNVRDTPRSPASASSLPPPSLPAGIDNPAPYRMRTPTPPQLESDDKQPVAPPPNPKVTMEWVLHQASSHHPAGESSPAPGLSSRPEHVKGPADFDDVRPGHHAPHHDWTAASPYREAPKSMHQPQQLHQQNPQQQHHGPPQPEMTMAIDTGNGLMGGLNQDGRPEGPGVPPCDQCRKRTLDCQGVGRSGRACDYCRRTKQRCSLAGTSSRKRASGNTPGSTKRRRVDKNNTDPNNPNANSGNGRGDHSDVDELSYSEGESGGGGGGNGGGRSGGGKSHQRLLGEKLPRPSSTPISDDPRLKSSVSSGLPSSGPNHRGARQSLPSDLDHDPDFEDGGETAADYIRRTQLSSHGQADFSPAQLMAMDDKLDEVLRGIGKWVGRVQGKLSQEDVREWLKVKSDSQSNFMSWANGLGKP